jgi:TPR repeat protein
MMNCPTVPNPLFTCMLASLCLLYATAPRSHAQRHGEMSPDMSDTGPRMVYTPQSLSGPVQSREVQEHLRKELALAADYFLGRGVPRDLTQSLSLYRKAAEEGEPLAQVELGYFYHVGIGVQRNEAEAARWYQRAAASGSVHGKINLASLYLRGEGVPQNAEVAVNLLRSAARGGSGTAEAYLGVMSYTGVGMKADAHAAEKWFKEGVKHHSAEAEFDLASLYSVHPEHAQDVGKAAKLLRLSAGRGYMPAKHSLGLLLVRHPELPQAPGEAASLLGSAAEAGSWRSSMLLGMLARDGRGLAKDQKAAYRWFRVAYLQGAKENGPFLTSAVSQMATALSEEDRRAGESEAAAWFQAHPNKDVYVINDGMDRKNYPLAEVQTMGLPAPTGATPANTTAVGGNLAEPIY